MSSPFNIKDSLSSDDEENDPPNQLLDVVIYREAGRATIQRARQHSVTPAAANSHHQPMPRSSLNTRIITARRTFIDFAVANQLSRMFTLTYATAPEQPVDAHIMFDKFMRRLRRRHPQLVWLQVTQRGARNHRLHHHLLTTRDLDRQLTQRTWAQGRIHTRDRTTTFWIRKQAGYLSKDFHLSPSERIGTRRYRRSRNGISPQPEHHLVTAAELDTLLASTAPAGYLKRFPPAGTPFHEWTAYWDPQH